MQARERSQACSTRDHPQASRSLGRGTQRADEERGVEKVARKRGNGEGSITRRKEITKQERKLAEAVNFGLPYGMSPAGLKSYARASYGTEMTKEEAARYWQHFFETYPGLRAWHDREYRGGSR